MNPTDFVKKYYPIAKEIEVKTKIPAIALLAQVALESGWMKDNPGFNAFGIKAKKGQKKQLLFTIENSNSNKPLKNVHKTIKIEWNEKKKCFVHHVLDWFRKYDNEIEAWEDYSRLLLISRYKPSLRWHYSPARYLISNWRLGYATDKNYGSKMLSMVKSIKKRM